MFIIGLSPHINTFKYHVSCPDGKISVELINFINYFFTVVPFNSCDFLSCRPFTVNTTFSNSSCWMLKFYKTCWECRVNDGRSTGKKNTTIEWDDGGKITTFSTGLVGCWSFTRPVENVVLTTEGLQERKTQLLNGTTVEK